MPIAIDLLKQVVMEQSVRTVPPDYVRRSLYEQVLPLKLNKEIIIIAGIRRCGKSTLLQKIRHEGHEQSYYLNFEDDRLINFDVTDFQLLLEVFIELFGSQKTIYFDEIQNIPEWERFVRRLHDDGYKIYITGSNATMLSKELGTKLTGRYIALTMYPYSFYEYVQFKMPTLADKKIFVTQDIAHLRGLFSDYLRVGGIPEYVKWEQSQYLHMLYESVLYRDIITRYKLPEEKPIKELAFLFASNMGKEITFNSLRKLIGLSNASTVSEYCDYLANSFLSFLINRYSHSLKQQILHGKKQYFIDHGLAGIIGFRTSEDRGRVLENIVYIELLRRNKEVYFHQQNKECDFVVKENNKLECVIQVCSTLSSPEVKQREYAGLIEAMHAYRLKKGFILTEDNGYEEKVTVEGVSYTIQAVTIWKWLLENVT
jgi:predicted AAA+ superfamily ATPase